MRPSKSKETNPPKGLMPKMAVPEREFGFRLTESEEALGKAVLRFVGVKGSPGSKMVTFLIIVIVAICA